MTQRNVRGAYFCPMHDRAQDWDFLAKWQPNVIRLMLHGSHSDPNSVSVPLIRRVHETCPDALILLRCWDVDDRNFEAHAAMVTNPQAEAEKQLDWWARLFDRVQDVPRKQLMAGLNNETGPEKDAALYAYTEHALTLGTQRAVRCGGLVFSVGRPSLPGESQYDMDYFSRLEPLFLAGDHAVLLHEYMQPEGMYAVWTDDQGRERKDYSYLIGRHKRWPMKRVKKIVAEWGIDGILYNRHPHPEFGNSGWRHFRDLWPPDRFADEYVECVRVADDTVIGTCPYLEDYADRKWVSFDLLDAYAQFIARKELCVRDAQPPALPPIPQPAPPFEQHLPNIIGSGPTATPITPAGARIRTGPGKTYSVLGAVATGNPMRVTAIDPGGTWYRVDSPFGVGWVSATVVSALSIGNVPVVDAGAPTMPPPSGAGGDTWSRAWPIVLKIEGGLSTDRNDKGNYRPDGTFVGTRWGISALSHPTVDIINLSKEDALKIYHRDYWLGGGCDRLEWPLCLVHFDAYVQNQNAAKKFLAASGGNPVKYLSERLYWYTTLDQWPLYSAGWARRIATMLAEVAK